MGASPHAPFVFGVRKNLFLLTRKRGRPTLTSKCRAPKFDYCSRLSGENLGGDAILNFPPLEGCPLKRRAIKVTIAKYFTPNATDIDHIGIEPDYIVTGEEAQLKEAIEVLRGGKF